MRKRISAPNLICGPNFKIPDRRSSASIQINEVLYLFLWRGACCVCYVTMREARPMREASPPTVASPWPLCLFPAPSWRSIFRSLRPSLVFGGQRIEAGVPWEPLCVFIVGPSLSEESPFWALRRRNQRVRRSVQRRIFSSRRGGSGGTELLIKRRDSWCDDRCMQGVPLNVTVM